MYLNVILYSIKLSWSWSCFAIAWPLTNPQDVVWAAISTFSSCQGASNVDVYPFHGYWVLRQRLWFNPCAHRHWRHCLCLVSHQLSSYQSWRIGYHSAFVLTFFHSSSGRLSSTRWPAILIQERGWLTVRSFTFLIHLEASFYWSANIRLWTLTETEIILHFVLEGACHV